MKYLLLPAALLMGLLGFGQQKEMQFKGKELFGSIKARHIGPALMSGRVSDIEGHPTNNKVMYIGSAGGGVWKSTNGGTKFNSIFDDYCQSIGCVKLDPKDPDNVVWVGTGETWVRNSTSVGDGLYRSMDGGKNWKHMGFKESERISSIQIDPNNTDVVYIGVLGPLWGDNTDRGVYKTEDGGKTWGRILAGNKNTGCADLVMDPKDPNTLYASFWEHRRTAWSFNSGGENSALYKSKDGGKNWEKIHNGFPSGKLGRIAVAVAPSNAQRMYAVVEAEKNSGLYRSDDAGATWKRTNSDFALVVRPFYFSRIVVDPTNPDIVAKAGFNGSISRDGGLTFKSLGQMHPDIHDIWFDVKDSDRMSVGTDGGLYHSFDGGSTLDMVDGLPLAQFYHVSTDKQEPYNIYGGLQDNGSWYGPSESPGGIEAKDWERIGHGDGFRVYSSPGNPDLMFSEMQGAEAIWRFDAKKKQIKGVKPYASKDDTKLRFNWNAAITTSVHEDNRLYVGSQFLHKSDDNGDTWVKISPDLTTNNPLKIENENTGGLSKDKSGAENHCTIFSIAESPLDANVLWVGTDDGNIQLSKDGGKTWENKIANIPGLPQNTWCYHIEASSFGKGAAYAVFDGHTSNDKNTYVYKTEDFGTTWKSIVKNENIDGFARAFQEDFTNPDLLYLGTEFGLYVTLDGGNNWTKFSSNMPSAAIHYIDLQKEADALVVGTHGRGIIIIDDLSPLREMTAEVMKKKVHFFENGPIEMWEDASFGGSSTETQFVGANPDKDAKITYFLPKRHTFGKMKLEVKDEEGNIIVDLAPKKQKGINMVSWNFKRRPPKVAKGKSFAFGAFGAPRVPAGNYNVVLTKGKEQFKHSLTLEYPKNSVYTLAERKVQQETSDKLYNMTEKLAYLVDEIDSRIAQANSLSSKSTSIGKQAKKMNAALMDLKKGLVVTTGDNYVGRGEPQLREKIANVYSAVISYPGKPTMSQLENVEIVSSQFVLAIESYAKIKKKHFKKMDKVILKAGLTPIKSAKFDAFILDKSAMIIENSGVE